MRPKRTAFVADEIERACVELLSEKYFLDITVTDIVAKAGVARVSFYRNYSSLDDVLESVIRRILTGLMEEVWPALDTGEERLWREFLFRFIFLVSDSNNRIAAVRPENLPVIFSKINNMRILEELTERMDTRQKYRSTGIMAMITSVIQQWLNDGRKESPEEMVDLLMELIRES